MNSSEIEQSIHEALDADDSETLELYAEHCAESLGELGEILCLAIIDTGGADWQAITARARRVSPGLVHALDVIEQHIDRERAAFIEKRAQKLADAAEHDAQCRAELNLDMRRTA